MRRLFVVAVIICFCRPGLAGGPEFVAGASFFDPAVMGTPLTWSQGAATYYTDQGDLRAVLPGNSADAFVAKAFRYWTSIPTAALSVTHRGQLAEDVNGGNVALVNGVLTLPADIQPSAVGTPVGIVYDQDGSVTDALLGTGASNSAFCANNSAFGGVDNYSAEAQFLHALVVLNGNCASSSAQLPDLQYHLVRVIGRVLRLDWSQANVNVITGDPSPAADDYRGFPVMHEIDPPGCVPVATCFSNHGVVDPEQPKMDDQAALSRLYPVTAQNAAPQQQMFSQATARIHGSVYFSDPFGNNGQPMQGVNVVARWIDPTTGLASRAYVASSISGFLYVGNAGNLITGFTDSSGQNFNQFGSSDQTVEGFYDLAGLQVPSESKTAQYQLTVEPVDPLWSENAGPYGTTSQVKPPRSSPPIIVTVSLGSDTQQDILMQGGATQTQEWYAPTTYAAPAQVPLSGNWSGALSSYGVTDYFQFPAQANRTLSIIVNAMDELGNPTTGKTLPVVGMWALADPGVTPAPAFTPSAFDTPFFAESRLDARILRNGVFRAGIADFRGDGRPDYLYNARVFYGDNISPARASVAGGTPLTIQGLGLQADTAVQAATVSTPVLACSAAQLLVQTPAAADGVYDVQLADAATGGNSDMSAVLTVGAGRMTQ
jgi:IPT/TIG domain